MADLGELLARVEAETGPDRELDCYIWGEAEGWTVHEVGNHIIVADKPKEVQMVLGYADPGKVARNVTISRTDIPAYTASIDAALALVERLLPGAEWQRRRQDDETAQMVVELAWLPGGGEEWDFAEADDSGSTPRAIIAALLRALAQQKQGEQK